MRDQDRLYDIIDALVEIADARDAAPAQVALAWLLRRPGIASLVIGARTEEQLEGNLKAVELTLAEGERSRLDDLSPAAHLSPLVSGQDRE